MGKCSGYYRCQNLNFVKKWDIAPLCCQTSICLLYIVMESDLKTLSAINILFKYADDTNLLVPEKTDVHLSAEFENILQSYDCQH